MCRLYHKVWQRHPPSGVYDVFTPCPKGTCGVYSGTGRPLQTVHTSKRVRYTGNANSVPRPWCFCRPTARPFDLPFIDALTLLGTRYSDLTIDEVQYPQPAIHRKRIQRQYSYHHAARLVVRVLPLHSNTPPTLTARAASYGRY